MISIRLENAGKRFGSEWIFRNLNMDLTAALPLAILGGNGSGKSTLIKSLLGYSTLTEGNMIVERDGALLKSDQFYKTLSFCSPYLELYEELTITEVVDFHFGLKPLKTGVSRKSFLEIIYLEHSANKAIKQLSSGMKQRLRLGLALLSDTEVVLLDEPTSNLDSKGVAWYKQLMVNYSTDRCIAVASNHLEAEYSFCTQILEIDTFKPS